jgi:type VI secretion system secreted protein Hcp
MNTVRFSFIAALASLGVPTALVAQEKLVARGGSASFTMTIEGTKQGVFAAAKGGNMAGLRFGYGAKSPRDAASGQASGKRQHGPVVVTKLVGTGSPQIFQALTTNEVLKSVVVVLPGEGGTAYTVKLRNAFVSEIKQYTDVVNGLAVVLEDVSFTFQRIEVEDPATKTMAMDDWMAGS